MLNISKAILLLGCILILINACGDDDSSPTSPTIPDPVASFSYSGETVAPATITFVNESENANQYEWDFGDGSTSSLENPVKTYATPGTYRVTLTATNSETSNSNAASKNIVISSPPPPDPVADFSYSGSMFTFEEISFQNESQYADVYDWDFGDGTTSSLENPTKIYSLSGIYTVRLLAINSETSKSDTALANLTISPPPDPIADFSYTGSTVTPADISFQNESQYADAYYWDFGDGRTSIQENPTITFTQHASYTITLVARNNTTSKSDTASQALVITPGKAFIDSVSIEQIPFTDSGGAGWDLMSGPDFFFELRTSSGNVLIQSSTITDLAPSDLPLTFYSSDPFKIPSWSSSYYYYLYDYDDLSANDLIGSTNFRIQTIISQEGYVEHVTLRNQSQTIRMRLALHWE